MSLIMANEKKLVTFDNIQQYHNKLYQVVDTKQDSLVSGSNIKTINGQSILGDGDITISGGCSSDANVQAVAIGDIVDDVIPTNYYVLPFTSNDLLNILNYDPGADLSDMLSSTEAYKVAKAINSKKLIYLPNDTIGYTLIENVCAQISSEDAFQLQLIFNLEGIRIKISGNHNGIHVERFYSSYDWYILHPVEDGIYYTGYCADTTTYAEEPLTTDNILIIAPSEISSNFVLHFMTGETIPEIQAYDDIFWPNGLIPQLEPNTEYELSVTWGYELPHAVLTPFKPAE